MQRFQSRALLSLVALVCLTAGLSAKVAPRRGQVFLTVEEALSLAFGEAEVERGTVYLTKEQKKAAQKKAGDKVRSAIVHPYVARDAAGKVIGTAYFDTHRVRTLDETIMVVVSPKNEILRIEVLAFGEPPDYVPRGVWYDQFKGKELGAELNLKRGIRGVTGATLTASATTKAARRVLALHEIINAPGSSSETERRSGVASSRGAVAGGEAR